MQSSHESERRVFEQRTWHPGVIEDNQCDLDHLPDLLQQHHSKPIRSQLYILLMVYIHEKSLQESLQKPEHVLPNP